MLRRGREESLVTDSTSTPQTASAVSPLLGTQSSHNSRNTGNSKLELFVVYYYHLNRAL